MPISISKTTSAKTDNLHLVNFIFSIKSTSPEHHVDSPPGRSAPMLAVSLTALANGWTSSYNQLPAHSHPTFKTPTHSNNYSLNLTCLHMLSSSPPTPNPCTPTFVLIPPSHTSPNSCGMKRDDPSTIMTPRPSPKHSTSSLKTTSSILETPIGGRYRVQAWALPQHPPGLQFITQSMKTGYYPAGTRTYYFTVDSLMISLGSGHVMSAPNTTTLSGPRSNWICNNGTVWSGNSPLYHTHATTWISP